MTNPPTAGPLPLRPLRPVPDDRHRPWAGGRLGDGSSPVGERWLAGPASLVETADGPTTLEALAGVHGAGLIGERGLARVGRRFPLLVKLIDAEQWLSLQVHPDDALATELYGQGSFGKAEAWLVLDAAPTTELVTGPRQDLAPGRLAEAIAAGTLGLDDCVRDRAVAGDTWYLAPGTLHAIGAGSFIYEIEQPSDLTFRVSDWGRPVSPDRPLHRVESGRAVVPSAGARLAGRGWRLDGDALVVPDFTLELVRLPGDVERRPAGSSVEVVTALGDGISLTGDGWTEPVRPYDTVVIPAALADYRISGSGDAVVCVGTVS